MKNRKDSGIPSLDESTLSGAMLDEFFCRACQKPLQLPQEVFERSHFDARCENCRSDIEVNLIYQDDDVEIHEFDGATFSAEKSIDILLEKTLITSELDPKHAAISDWIRANADEGASEEDEHASEESPSFLDEYISNWIIKTEGGQEFEFKYFSTLREWIAKGKLSASDKVCISDGEIKRLDEYPGTADLFGNPYLRGDVRFGSGNRRFPQPYAVENPAAKRRPGLLLLTFALSFMAPTLHFAYQWTQSSRGQAIHSQVQSKMPTISPGEMDVYLEEVAGSLRNPSTPALIQSERYLRDLLAIAPSETKVMAGLISTWTELSKVMKNPTLLSQAKELESYAFLLNSRDANLLESKARRLWREGKLEEATETLEKLVKRDELGPDGKALFAQISLDRGDYQSATVYLDAALEETGATEFYLRLFVDLLSRQNKSIEAASYLERIIATNPGKEKDFLRLASLYTKAGDTDSAMSILRKARVQGHDTAENRIMMIELLDQREIPEDTVFESLEFLDLYGDHARAPQIREIYENAIAELTPEADVSKRPRSNRSRRTRRAPRIRRR